MIELSLYTHQYFNFIKSRFNVKNIKPKDLDNKDNLNSVSPAFNGKLETYNDSQAFLAVGGIIINYSI